VAALELDMTRWFQATAEIFFDRISKTNILEALRAAGKDAGSIRQTLKKAELAKVAEHDLTQSGYSRSRSGPVWTSENECVGT
jgi:ParB family transcriptional regulator, chromosome partitioning protein